MKIRTLVAAAAATLGCTACGFKGPLYLPQQNAAVVTHAAPANTVAPQSPQTPGAKPRDKKQQQAVPPSGR